jgi:hypothetical protein
MGVRAESKLGKRFGLVTPVETSWQRASEQKTIPDGLALSLAR